MKYKKWEYRNGAVIVEKYAGVTNLDEILSNDDDILSNTGPHIGPLKILSDISEASFPNIPHKDLGKLFQSIDKHSEASRNMKIALFVGMNQYEDFKKATAYADHSLDRPISVMFFNHLDMAMDWLGFLPNEQKQVINQLSKKL